VEGPVTNATDALAMTERIRALTIATGRTTHAGLVSSPSSPPQHLYLSSFLFFL
jgi:hypothetical protein